MNKNYYLHKTCIVNKERENKLISKVQLMMWRVVSKIQKKIVIGNL
jgi:hypothetical protein